MNVLPRDGEADGTNDVLWDFQCPLPDDEMEPLEQDSLWMDVHCPLVLDLRLFITVTQASLTGEDQCTSIIVRETSEPIDLDSSAPALLSVQARSE